MTTRSARPATPGQMDYLRSLAQSAGVEIPTELTTREASALIDELRAAPPADTNTGRWAQFGDDWVIRSAGSTGDLVTVTTRRGRTSQIILGAEVDDNLFIPINTDTGPTDGLDLNPLFDGLFTTDGKPRTKIFVAVRTDDDDVKLIQIDRPRAGKWEGHIFVKNGSAYSDGRKFGRQRPNGCFEPNEDRYADWLAVVLEDRNAAFKLYADSTNHCGVCNRPLEDDDTRGPDGLTSVERGVGPVCAKNGGWFA